MNRQLIIATALRSLHNHKARSILTTLGIIIGVMSIICVMSIGEGAKYKINSEIQKLGCNFIVVLSTPQKKLNTRNTGANATLRKRDTQAIIQECDKIEYLSPGLIVPAKIKHGTINWNTSIGGVNEHYLAIRDWKLTAGRFFGEEDLRAHAKVAVLGSIPAKELFAEGVDPIGKKIRIKKVPFIVIGLLDELGKQPDGTDPNDIILAPVSTVITKLRKGIERYNAIIMTATSKEVMNEATVEVRSILRQSRKINDNSDDDFSIFSQNDIAQASEAASLILSLLLLIIASISLIVGGIGIMNIMLVTVTERTKEIGIRMAIGASTLAILSQFLLESVVICLFGGLIGATLGISGAVGIGLLLGWPIVISIQSVIVSVGSSVFIGLFFGYYPAYKASRLNPVEALIER